MTSSDDDWRVPIEQLDEAYECNVCDEAYREQWDAVKCEWNHTTGGTAIGGVGIILMLSGFVGVAIAAITLDAVTLLFALLMMFIGAGIVGAVSDSREEVDE